MTQSNEPPFDMFHTRSSMIRSVLFLQFYRSPSKVKKSKAFKFASKSKDKREKSRDKDKSEKELKEKEKVVAADSKEKKKDKDKKEKDKKEKTKEKDKEKKDKKLKQASVSEEILELGGKCTTVISSEWRSLETWCLISFQMLTRYSVCR